MQSERENDDLRTRQIPPSGPPDDYRLMAVVMLEGHGRPEQLLVEYRKAMTQLLWNEFGELAKLTLLRVTDDSQATEEVTLPADDPVVLTDHPDSGLVED